MYHELICHLNLHFILFKAAGIGYSNIFKSVVYLKTMKDYSKFNEVYKKYFKKDYPARTLVEVIKSKSN